MTNAHTPRRLLVTGGAGFIGANFIRHVLANHPDCAVANLDALTYAGSPANVDELNADFPDRHTFIHADIRDAQAVDKAFESFAPDTVVNFAAESHVDRSIDNPIAFVETNVLGVAVLLEAARRFWRGRGDTRFHHVSTDEVFGSLGPSGLFTEDSNYDPSSPYSASKAAADHLVRAWRRTYGLPVTLSNCSNNYGPRQFPEKLIPLMLNRALEGKPLPVYGRGENIRDWLYVDDHAEALWLILTRGESGESYNIGGENEWRNIDLVRLLCGRLDAARPREGGVPYENLVAFVADRPGHDLRYAIDCSRIRRELGWLPRHSFAEGLDLTIQWYLTHPEWLSATRHYRGQRLGLAEKEPPGAPAAF